MEEAKVSVIVPLYNAEQYAERILGQIRQQTYEKLEIVIVNDGSTDGTGKLCEEIAAQDGRVHYIVQKNTGVGAARNRGLSKAIAPCVMFVDADDEIDLDFVEKLLSPLVVQGADMSVADIDNIDTATGKHNLSRIRLAYGVTETETDLNVISKVRTFCWGKIYRKSLWQDNAVLFPEGDLYRTMPGFEDVCCLPLLAARARRIAHVGGAHYHYYRGHEGSLMHEAKFRYFMNSQRELLRRFAEAGLAERFHASLRQFIVGQLVSANRWKLSMEEVEEMWDLLAEYFPELAFLRGRSIYVPPGWQRDVMQHVVFDRHSMVDSPQKGAMDCFSQVLARKLDSEYENFCYDMADRLINSLPHMGEAMKEENIHETATGYGHYRN